MPDERCRILRHRLARREQLVRARSRSKNEIHASLQRRLQAKPPCSDLFGVKDRRWLAALELPPEERESVDAVMRHVEFLDAEIAAAEKLIENRGLVLVHADPRRGLRPSAAVADPREAAAAGDHRRRELAGFCWAICQIE